MTQHSYEKTAAENWPKNQLPPDDGRHCPPFEGTLYRLAEAKHRGTPLAPELENVQRHIETCGSCRSTVTGALSLFAAESKTDDNSQNALGDVSWEGTPLRRLRDAGKSFKSASGTPREELIRLGQSTGLTEAETLESVGCRADKYDCLDGEEGLELLRLLGVEERLPSTVSIRPVEPSALPADPASIRVLAPKQAGNDEKPRK